MITRGQNIRDYMYILTNKKVVEHHLGYMELQGPHYTCYLWTQKSLNYSSHQHKSLTIIQQRNLRSPQKYATYH